MRRSNNSSSNSSSRSRRGTAQQEDVGGKTCSCFLEWTALVKQELEKMFQFQLLWHVPATTAAAGASKGSSCDGAKAAAAAE